MAASTRSTSDSNLVKVAYAHDQAEAEFLEGLLNDADVGSVVRRAPGFDVPEFLAGGPRHVLVAASDVPVARDILRQAEPDETAPPTRSSARPAVAGARRAADRRGIHCVRRLPRHRRARLSRRQRFQGRLAAHSTDTATLLGQVRF
jgi:hypothetical protein